MALTVRPLAEDRLCLITGLAVHADSKFRLVNEFVKAAGGKLAGTIGGFMHSSRCRPDSFTFR